MPTQVVGTPQPVVVIRAGARNPLDLSELWAFRELLYFLVWRDICVRYKQTLLGASWAILQPLASMTIFWIFFGRLSGFSVPGVPYPLYAYSGFVLWTFFANAVSAASNSLAASAYLVTKVYFPRVIIPAAAVLAAFVDLLLSLLPLVVLLALYRVAPSWTWLGAPLAFAGTTLLALGVGTLLAALNVKYRDVRHAVPFVLQMWMFATPTFYSLDVIPERFRWIALANPATGLVQFFRSTVLGLPFDALSMLWAGIAILVSLLIGLAVFRRMERTFADIV